ncbi:hypothetical protein FC84_GL001656 [Lapidilactobacillus dextrinicus DSM 20335]|uniref:Uncharacterized protein n=1 Tax=Lapidilactobacillus dextrinicus DSM 20335 TaxID=1423738 RepID=A0A0R2BNK6_9LACO|nr:hypothetical protein [Lapidilactobacillus dextrinicus]KRM79476.1 hypothetical protein FC84_GL001656 [Lapidilactobacillus dextrinicus DSM 20335]QFG46688.1 hypothetical protein LH506_04175 [Lapidilactobacillus dextrinicus]
MIITLDEAKEIDDKVTQGDLDAYETIVRNLTNNNFQNTLIRFRKIKFTGPQEITLYDYPLGLRIGDTIQVSDSTYNDGLAVISSIEDTTLTVTNEEPFFEGSFFGAFITKIQYPNDIKYGVKGLVEYKHKMGSKLGIKSETIARMSVTYYDINATDNIEGFPAAKFSFLKKYKKMRWG